jgi:shikimate 5-dehydrogenase
MPSAADSPKRLYLFGYPVAHSASPAFQNECFKNLGIPNTFTTWSTSKIDKQMLDEIRSDESGGAA